MCSVLNGLFFRFICRRCPGGLVHNRWNRWARRRRGGARKSFLCDAFDSSAIYYTNNTYMNTCKINRAGYYSRTSGIGKGTLLVGLVYRTNVVALQTVAGTAVQRFAISIASDTNSKTKASQEKNQTRAECGASNAYNSVATELEHTHPSLGRGTVTVLYLELDPGVYKVGAPGKEGRHLQLRRSEKAPLRPHDRADSRT